MRMPYYLGCPVWGCAKWKGRVYRQKTPRKDWLKEYAQSFAAIEGNMAFHRLPSVETAKSWASEVTEGFQFALKVPQVISHDKRLRGVEAETQAFIDALRVLQETEHLGPTLLNLRPNFGAADFDVLAQFLRAWPTDLPLAVEPRHLDYFDNGDTERAFDVLLSELRMDRALFDTRALHAKPATTKDEQNTQEQAPNLPHRATVTGPRPFLRLMGRDDLTQLSSMIDEWADVLMKWIDSDLTPYVFVHTPDYAFNPDFAKLFHAAVRLRRPDIPALPETPGELEQRTQLKQRPLFE